METKTEYKAASDTVPFKERVDRLVRELERAIRFDRPSILLAIYQSELVRAEAEKAIARQLHEMGQRTERVTINEEKYDLPLYLVQQPDHEKTVYFVQGLQWGGGEDGRNTYRALNIRREYFVDYRLRFILWLTEKEAYNLPRYAPDFWAFRHRVVEFFDPPDEEQIAKHTGSLIMRDLLDDQAWDQDIEANIGYRERLLMQLGGKQETTLQRLFLLLTLGALYGNKGMYDTALKNLTEALNLAIQLEDYLLQSVAYSGRGDIYDDLEQYEKALTDYDQAIQLDPNNAYAFYNRGITYHKLDQYEKALADFDRAIKLDPDDARAFYYRSNVYHDLGWYEKALADYDQAIQLDPNNAYAYNNRGLTYHKLGEYEKALADYDRAIQLNPVDGITFYNRGFTYTDLREYEKALADYNRAVQLNPDDAVLAKRLEGLTTVLKQTGHLKATDYR
jgi:tetratricopeptide (TPR) repeat protein